MDLEKVYRDSNGNKCNILEIIEREPEWVANRIQALEKKVSDRGYMLEDVVNELDLSECAINKHGPLGTAPAELVRLVLDEKDMRISALKNGLKVID